MPRRIVLKLGGSLLTQPDWYVRLRDWILQQPSGRYFMIVGGGEAVEAMRELDRIHALDQEAMHWRCVDLLDASFEIAAELLGRVINNLVVVRTQMSLQAILSSIAEPMALATGTARRSETRTDQTPKLTKNAGGNPELALTAQNTNAEPMALATGDRAPESVPNLPEASAYGSELELVLIRVSSFYNKHSYDSPINDLSASGVSLPEIGWQTTSDTLAMYLASVSNANECVLFKSCEVESFEDLDAAAVAGVVDAQVLRFSKAGTPCRLIKL
jgi:aspartokinase-like uncharacterized kinase